MANYTQNVFFAPKDALTTGDPNKKIKGTEIDAEFAEISSALSTKEDASNRGVPNGYASLGADGLVPNAQMPAASETVRGGVELATNAETVTGTDNTRAAHPAGVKAAIAAASIADTQITGTTVFPRLNGNNDFTGTQTVTNANPSTRWVESDAAADNQMWRIRVAGETFRWEAVNDAVTVSGAFMTVDRTGTTIDSVTFNGTNINLEGVVGVSGTLALTNAAPRLMMYDTDAPANEKGYSWSCIGGDIALWTDTDATAHSTQVISIARNGLSIDSINLAATSTIGLYANVYVDQSISVGNFDTTLSRIAAGRLAIEGLEVGYRQMILLSTGAATASTTVVGKAYSATGAITVPSATFAAGDIFTVYNNSASTIGITQGSGLTLRWAGTATTGSRTLAQRGLCTVLFISASEAVVSGDLS